ncbi:MAG: anthranilate phosphoribosyltransferase [Candidatus Kerfeldbacteria bacterium]|nr:anthranilate phosphoribosyltransferase [Candidatus Kerfeldbacteria bacterium]
MNNIIQQLQRGEDLTIAQAEQVMDQLMAGQIEAVPMAAILMGLATKGETTDELVGMLHSVHKHMIALDLGQPLLDTCGTGGDHANTINLSTMAALVCAALGVSVAKHGNRAVSSQSGSADVLAALGVPIDLTGQAAQQYFKQHHFVFLFAPLYHPAFKQLASVRKQLGIRTIMNLLGPLANPARASHRLLGVADLGLADMLGQTLMELGVQHAVVVHSADNLDEVSIAAPTTVFDFTQQGSNRFRIEPDTPFRVDDMAGGTAKHNAAVIRQLAEGKASRAVITAVAMNAGLALYAADQATSYEAGKTMAEQCLRSHTFGAYLQKLTPQ